MEEQTFEAYVHKAAVPFMKNETLSDFQTRLRKAAIESTTSPFTLNKNDSFYVTEVFSDSVVFSWYNYDESSKASYEDRQKYIKVPYTRDKSGAFTFGKKQEVMRVTSFEPVSGSDLMDITKSATPDFEVVSKSLWKPVSIFKGIV